MFKGTHNSHLLVVSISKICDSRVFQRKLGTFQSGYIAAILSSLFFNLHLKLENTPIYKFKRQLRVAITSYIHVSRESCGINIKKTAKSLEEKQ